MNNRISDEVLKEIFPKKIERSLISEQIYSYIKRMILTGKLKKGQRLLRWDFIQLFDVNEAAVSGAFSKLRRDGLIFSKSNKGSFVA